MSGPIAKQAVVIGAGMGGLCAAKAVAPFFETVTVLERDALPQTPSPRAGTPQDRQLHVLLAGGSRALESLFGGIENKLVKAGAVKVQLNRDVLLEYPGCDFLPRRDLGVPITCQSRPLLEWICRKELQREPNVEIRPRCTGERALTLRGPRRCDRGPIRSGRRSYDNSGRPHHRCFGQGGADAVLPGGDRSKKTVGKRDWNRHGVWLRHLRAAKRSAGLEAGQQSSRQASGPS